jgi:uncharacterized Zn finger protein
MSPLEGMIRESKPMTPYVKLVKKQATEYLMCGNCHQRMIYDHEESNFAYSYSVSKCPHCGKYHNSKVKYPHKVSTKPV